MERQDAIPVATHSRLTILRHKTPYKWHVFFLKTSLSPVKKSDTVLLYHLFHKKSNWQSQFFDGILLL
jgi:hypothetical protein